MCEIGLTTTWPEERMVQLSNMGMQLQQPFQCGHNQSGRHGCGHSPIHLSILKRYITLYKKVSGFPTPSRDVTYQTFPGRE